jgi:DNA-binding NarL/FixJ family response regulator
MREQMSRCLVYRHWRGRDLCRSEPAPSRSPIFEREERSGEVGILGDTGVSRRRVVIVDNDAVTRAGVRAILEGCDQIEVVSAVDHDGALAFAQEWADLDVALVDASDARRGGDQFPGVAVVEAARSRRGPQELMIIVLTGQSLHEGLRRRMWEARADFFVARDEGMTEAELIGIVLNPAENRRLPPAAPIVAAHLGVSPGTSVNSLVRNLDTPEISAALRSDGAKKSDPHGARSRWWGRVRAIAAGPQGLEPRGAEGGHARDRDQPSVPQLRKFLTAFTKVEAPDGR